jgi:hypothetical protein
MLNTSECPNDARESSLLRVLEDPRSILRKFYLSQEAAAGVLKRSGIRRVRLPAKLVKALRFLVG